MVLGHTALAELTAPFRVRGDSGVARMLFRFALAERGSYLTMRWAAELTENPGRRALYLRHALDELRHSHMFERRARELGVGMGDVTDADAEDLFTTLGEHSFLAFVTLAESRGKREFEGYRRALEARGDTRSAAVFSALLDDETRHASYSRELLDEMSRSRGWATFSIVRVALWETWRSVRRSSAALGVGLYAVLASVLYLLVIPPIWFWLRRARPASARWIDRR